MSVLRLGLIGCGAIAQDLALVSILTPAVKLAACADPKPERLDWFRKRYGVRAGYTDHRQMLQEVSIDAVYVIVAPEDCPDLVVECLEAVPTPASLTSDDEAAAVRAEVPTGTA